MRRLLLFPLLAGLVTLLHAGSPRAVVRAEIINENAPYPESHASTIAEPSPGNLVAAWFGGTKERHPDVGIWVARHEHGRWQPAVEVANGLTPDGQRFPTWNPVLFQPREGPLVLFYKVGPNPREWWGMITTSTDGGKTWAAPRRLAEGILGPIKNKPIELADGNWLSPSSSEGNDDGWRVHFELSSDRGTTWRRSGSPAKGPGLDAIQPSVLRHPDGRLQALCRTKQGVIAMTWSTDRGETWSGLAAVALPNPNSGTDAVTLADGRHLLLYNHSAHRPEQPGKGDRWPLDVAISSNGITWQRVVSLETEPLPSGYAYPAVIQTADGLVHITYTYGRKAIKHVVIDPRQL